MQWLQAAFQLQKCDWSLKAPMDNNLSSGHGENDRGRDPYIRGAYLQPKNSSSDDEGKQSLVQAWNVALSDKEKYKDTCTGT